MGLFGFSKSSCDKEEKSKSIFSPSTSCIDKERSVVILKTEQQIPLPNPDNYTIKRYFYDRGFLLIEIKYHGCTHYEGRKILLFKNVTLEELKEQKLIDPHFSKNDEFHSPIARFEPTKDGWEMGLRIVDFYTEDKKELIK